MCGRRGWAAIPRLPTAGPFRVGLLVAVLPCFVGVFIGDVNAVRCGGGGSGGEERPCRLFFFSRLSPVVTKTSSLRGVRVVAAWLTVLRVWRCQVLRPGLVKGPWTKEEDDIICTCMATGVTKWSEIAVQIPGRIGKQCRERWYVPCRRCCAGTPGGR